MTDPNNPLCLVAGRSVANAESYYRYETRPQAAIREAAAILIVLQTFEPSDLKTFASDLAFATIDVARHGITATEAWTQLKALVAAVREQQVEANREGEAA